MQMSYGDKYIQDYSTNPNPNLSLVEVPVPRHTLPVNSAKVGIAFFASKTIMKVIVITYSDRQGNNFLRESS
jgi:hypothetical protein